MAFDIDTLEAQRRQHPAWRLLLADFREVELLASRPLQQGLAELVAYLSLAAEPPEPGKGVDAMIDDSVEEQVAWVTRSGQRKSARLPRVIFSR